MSGGAGAGSDQRLPPAERGRRRGLPRRLSRRLSRRSAPAPRRSPREPSPRRRRVVSDVTVGALAAAAAAGGALAGVHPTGTPVVDPIYGAALAALITVACSRARRWSLLVLSAVGVIMSRAWLLAPAGAALIVAFASTFQVRSRRRVAAVVGALSSQVLLRWPHLLFHGFTALVALGAVLPCLVSGYRNTGWRWRRRLRWGTAGAAGAAVLLGGPLVVCALLARGPVERGQADAHGVLASVGSAGTRALQVRLAAAGSDFSRARRLVSPWWTAGAYLIPGEAQQRRALVPATAAGERVAVAAQSVSANLTALRSSYHDGRVDLSAVSGLAAPLAKLDAALASAQHQTSGVGSAWLLPPVNGGLTRLRADLSKARSTIQLARQAVPVLPPLLGADGTRRYFVAFMTPSESRGLDGFIGSYALLTVKNGHVTLSAANRIQALIATGRPGQRRIAGPADYLARYGAFDPAYYLMDLTYSPDFPTVASVIAQLYPQTGGPPIDGVLALDPYALAALLHFTGPISVPGLQAPLTYQDAAQVLTVGQYLDAGSGAAAQTARHDELQYALRAAFAKLTTTSLPSPGALSSTLSPLVHQGRLLFWSLHPSEQPLLRRVGLAGAFPTPAGGDLLAVTTNNSGNNKLDAYLQRRVEDQVTYSPADGAVRSTVTISLQNTAPAGGLPAYVAGSYSGSHLPFATNYTWLSVYSPLHLSSATVGGAPVPMTSTPELGVNTYATHVIIPAGDTVNVVLHLNGTIAAGATYRMTLRNQPMVHRDTDTIQVRPVPGWQVAPAGNDKAGKKQAGNGTAGKKPAGTLWTWRPDTNLVDDTTVAAFSRG